MWCIHTFRAILLVFLLCAVSTKAGYPPGWMPTHIAKLFPGDNVNFTSACNRQTNAEFSGTAEGGVVKFDAGEEPALICTDFYLLATMKSLHIQLVVRHGVWKDDFDWKQDEWVVAKEEGLHLFEITESVLPFFEDAVAFLEMITGVGYNPVKAREVIEKLLNYTFEPRIAAQPYLELDKKDILSGDQLAILRFSGASQFIQIGTGSLTSHHASALWIDGELYVAEALGASRDWPYPPYGGVIRTPWDDWMKQASSPPSNSLVVFLRLAPEYRKRYDEAAAVKFFLDHEGIGYGYYTLFYGWLDVPGEGNFAATKPFGLDDIELFLYLVDIIDPSVTNEFFNAGLNLRLGTKNLSYGQILDECADRNITITDLIIIPEKDGWIYPNGTESMVCDVFALRMYAAAGVFGDLNETITYGEFTPKDLYQTKLWDPDFNPCPKDWKSEEPYCQLMGDWWLKLNEFNSVEPYKYMNNHCPFFRAGIEC